MDINKLTSVVYFRDAPVFSPLFVDGPISSSASLSRLSVSDPRGGIIIMIVLLKGYSHFLMPLAS
jgi:hypothetical protein